MMAEVKSAGMVEAAKGFSLDRFATGARADFRFAPLNALLLVALFVAGLVAHLATHEFDVRAVYLTLGSALVLAIVIRLSQVWEVVVVAGTACGLLTYLAMRPASEILLITVVVAVLLAPAIQIAYEWERAVMLRFGRFRRLRAPHGASLRSVVPPAIAGRRDAPTRSILPP